MAHLRLGHQFLLKLQYKSHHFVFRKIKSKQKNNNEQLNTFPKVVKELPSRERSVANAKPKYETLVD